MSKKSPTSALTDLQFATKLGVSEFVVHRTLKEQGSYPYHVQKVQALEPADFSRRGIYCESLKQYRERPYFLNCVVFTDEAGFTILTFGPKKIHTLVKKNGIVNDRLVEPYILPNKLANNSVLEEQL